MSARSGVLALFLAVLGTASLVTAAQTLKFSAQHDSVLYLPGNYWIPVQANGAYDDGTNDATGQFLISDTNLGRVRFIFPTASPSVEFWGWQRSDGGHYSVTIDDGKPVIVDYHNETSTGDDSPLLLFSKTGLQNKVHTLIIKNIEDDRFGRPGQMNVDHFVLHGNPPTPTATPAPPVSVPTIPPRAKPVTMKVSSADEGVSLEPTDGQWISVGANGALAGTGKFLIADKEKGKITFRFPSASPSFEFWAWQRSDGGNATISIDGGKPVSFSYHNATSSGDDGPLRLYSKTGLSNKVHTVVITNAYDTRTKSYGQLNADSFRIFGVPPIPKPPVFPLKAKMAESEMEYSYHVKIAVGADSPANGGSGQTVSVLFDSGATGVWLNWVGCTDPVCGELTPYTPSTQHFFNSTIQDSISYGPGGPDYTMASWRVNDTVTLGSATIPSTTFGAAYDLPGSQPFDGNFGMGKGYCNGELCAEYPSFVYLAHNDEHPVSLKSVAQIGGIDRRKFTGSVDWTFVNSQSQWQIPHSRRSINVPISGQRNRTRSVELTDKFTHPVLTLDTGSPGLVGLPTGDWNILVKEAGAKQDENGAWRFPCGSTMTWYFHGSQGRDYTIPLGKPGTDDALGFCEAGPDDSGPTTNWITGAQFLDQYYVAWYFGEHGVGSKLGFAKKNVNLAARTMQPVVGIA